MESAAARLVAKELRLTLPQRSVTFHGRSMEPFLRDGDELTLEPVVWDDIRPGDVLAYRLDEKFPTLRVVHKSSTKLILRGDNWPATDFEVWPDDVLGRVVARCRGADILTRGTWPWRLVSALTLADDRLRRGKRRAVKTLNRVRAGLTRRLVRMTSQLGERPASLHVNVSARCNLGCKMCPYLPVHGNPSYVELMCDETFERIAPTLRHLPAVHFSGSGEPLFNRRLVRFIERSRTVNPAIHVTITCNGTLLTTHVARDLVRVGLDRLVVSIDGASERTVSSIRIGINLANVLANLRTLARVKEEAGSVRPVVRINYVIGYGSYAELPDFVRSASGLGVREIHVLEVLTGSAEAWHDNLVNSLARDNGRALRDAKKQADAAGIELLLPYTQHDACFHPFTPHVSEQGGVSPCCYVDYEGRTLWREGQEIRLPRIEYGNVKATPFSEIWRSSAFTTLRERDKRGDFPDFCRSCHAIRAETSRAVHAVMD